MITKKQGNSIAEYALIIAFVAVLVLAAVSNLGKQVNTSFVDINNALKNKETILLEGPKAILVRDGKVKGGDFSGTREKPQIRCANNVCSVDFGDYALNNIPKDFKEHVESSGFSGGGMVLADMFDQLVQQNKLSSHPMDEDILSSMSLQAQNIAAFEKHIEISAQEMLINTDAKAKGDFVMPSNMLKHGFYRTEFDRMPILFNDKYNSATLTDEEKALKDPINFLSLEITGLADNMSDLGSDINGNKYTEAHLNAILQPNASTITKTDAAVVCLNAENPDTCKEIASITGF